MEYSTIARKLGAQLEKFLGVVCGEECKVVQRFVAEMVYGISARQSVLISEVARSLEEPISVKKTHERLVRQLERPGLDKRLQGRLLRYSGERVEEDDLLILDMSEITKRYARKMEHLAKVRDGSDQGELKLGYWLVQVVATTVGGERLLPLYQRLYSAAAPQFESENVEIERAIEAIAAQTKGRGIWVMDRGCDREKLFDPLLEQRRRFIIRLRGDRTLLCGRRAASALEHARHCSCPYTETVLKSKGAQCRPYDVSFGFLQVKLPWREEPLWLVVVRGFGEQPLLLLTTEPLRRKRKLLWRICRSYFRRWAIEETIRYLKQSYDLENVRVLRYQSLQNLFVLALLASHFACAVLGLQDKLRVMSAHVLAAAKRIFDIPHFLYYALADGMQDLFSRHPCPPRPRRSKLPLQQLSLFVT